MEEEAFSVTAVVPMKPLSDSKTRLARKFSKEQRGDLAIGMLRRVIMAIQATSIKLRN